MLCVCFFFLCCILCRSVCLFYFCSCLTYCFLVCSFLSECLSFLVCLLLSVRLLVFFFQFVLFRGSPDRILFHSLMFFAGIETRPPALTGRFSCLDRSCVSSLHHRFHGNAGGHSLMLHSVIYLSSGSHPSHQPNSGHCKIIK